MAASGREFKMLHTGTKPLRNPCRAQCRTWVAKPWFRVLLNNSSNSEARSSLPKPLMCDLHEHSGAGGHILWLGEVRRSSPYFVTLSLCLGRPCFSSSDVFLFCWAAILSISLLASVSLFPLLPTLLDSCANARVGQGFCAWTHFLAFMEWADVNGSRLAAWSYVPARSSSCSLRVFSITFS